MKITRNWARLLLWGALLMSCAGAIAFDQCPIPPQLRAALIPALVATFAGLGVLLVARFGRAKAVLGIAGLGALVYGAYTMEKSYRSAPAPTSTSAQSAQASPPAKPASTSQPTAMPASAEVDMLYCMAFVPDAKDSKGRWTLVRKETTEANFSMLVALPAQNAPHMFASKNPSKQTLVWMRYPGAGFKSHEFVLYYPQTNQAFTYLTLKQSDETAFIIFSNIYVADSKGSVGIYGLTQRQDKQFSIFTAKESDQKTYDIEWINLDFSTLATQAGLKSYVPLGVVAVPITQKDGVAAKTCLCVTMQINLANGTTQLMNLPLSKEGVVLLSAQLNDCIPVSDEILHQDILSAGWPTDGGKAISRFAENGRLERVMKLEHPFDAQSRFSLHSQGGGADGFLMEVIGSKTNISRWVTDASSGLAKFQLLVSFTAPISSFAVIREAAPVTPPSVAASKGTPNGRSSAPKRTPTAAKSKTPVSDDDDGLGSSDDEL